MLTGFNFPLGFIKIDEFNNNDEISDYTIIYDNNPCPTHKTYIPLATIPPLVTNGSFEQGVFSPTGVPSRWQRDAWQYSSSIFGWDNTVAYNGIKSVKISTTTQNDARWIQTISVKPNTNYRLSGWIRTINVIGGSGTAGANIGLLGTWDHSTGLVGTNDWTYVSMNFNSSSNIAVTIACRLGMWSDTVTGTMWCDQIELVPTP